MTLPAAMSGVQPTVHGGPEVLVRPGADWPLCARVICGTNQPEPLADNPLGFVAVRSEHDGAFVQVRVVPARHLHDVTPSPLSDITVDAMPFGFGTAWTLLRRAGVAAGPEAPAGRRTICLNEVPLLDVTPQPREVFAGLLAAITARSLRSRLSQTYPVRDVAPAQADPTAGRHPDKLVLISLEIAA